MKHIIKRVLGSLLICATALMNNSCSEEYEVSDYYYLYYPNTTDLVYDDDTASKIYYSDLYLIDVIPMYVGVVIDLDFEFTAPDGFNTGIWEWSSSDESVATVDENGVITAVGAGVATIRIGIANSVSTVTAMNDSVMVSVSNSFEQVTSIELSCPVEYIYEGGYTAQLSAAVVPSTATYTNMKWSSSNTSIATVSSTGLVTSTENKISEQEYVTITATSVDGTNVSASTTIEIRPAVDPSEVAFTDSTKALDGAAFAKNQNGFTIEYDMVPSYAAPGAIVWTSSNTSAATVEGGVVTFVGYSANEVTITATCPDTGDSDSISFTVPAGYIYQDYTSSVQADWDWAVSESHISSGATQTWNPLGYLDIVTYDASATNYQCRSDLACFDGANVGFNSSYPFLAINLLDVLTYDYINSRSVKITYNGQTNGTGDSYSGTIANQKYTYYYELGNGTQIMVWDLDSVWDGKDFWPQSGTNVFIPTTSFNLVYADMQAVDPTIKVEGTGIPWPYSWELHSIMTFKTIADVEAYITNVIGTSFEETKASAE